MYHTSLYKSLKDTTQKSRVRCLCPGIVLLEGMLRSNLLPLVGRDSGVSVIRYFKIICQPNRHRLLTVPPSLRTCFWITGLFPEGTVHQFQTLKTQQPCESAGQGVGSHPVFWWVDLHGGYIPATASLGLSPWISPPTNTVRCGQPTTPQGGFVAAHSLLASAENRNIFSTRA